MKMCDTERHQLTNEMRQTGFRAGFFPGLIGINCERLQSTTRRLTFASSERFLLIVLMITSGAGDHHGVGRGRAGGGCLVPGFPATCCRRAVPRARLWGTGQNPTVGLDVGTYADKETPGNPNVTPTGHWSGFD